MTTTLRDVLDMHEELSRVTGIFGSGNEAYEKAMGLFKKIRQALIKEIGPEVTLMYFLELQPPENCVLGPKSLKAFEAFRSFVKNSI